MADEVNKPTENEEKPIEAADKNFTEKASDAFDKVSEEAKKVGEKASDTYEKVSASAKVASEKAGDTFEKVSQGAKVAGEKAVDAFDSFAESAKIAGAKAGEVLEDLADTTKTASKKAGEKASEVAGTVVAGIKKMREKASDAVEVLEVKRAISKLEGENRTIASQISDKVLELYAVDKLKEASLVELCDGIEKNKKMIEEKLAQIETIKTTDSE